MGLVRRCAAVDAVESRSRHLAGDGGSPGGVGAGHAVPGGHAAAAGTEPTCRPGLSSRARRGLHRRVLLTQLPHPCDSPENEQRLLGPQAREHDRPRPRHQPATDGARLERPSLLGTRRRRRSRRCDRTGRARPHPIDQLRGGSRPIRLAPAKGRPGRPPGSTLGDRTPSQGRYPSSLSHPTRTVERVFLPRSLSCGESHATFREVLADDDA